MLEIPLALTLQLTPLAFGPKLPPPLVMPRELVCDVRDLGRLTMARPMAIPNLPRFSTPKPGRAYLFGPRTDHLIYVAGILAAGFSGGCFDGRSPEQKIQEQIFSGLSR